MRAQPAEMRQAIPALGDMVKLVEWGEMAVAAITLVPGTDFAPVLSQLPGGGCMLPHWGFVHTGRLTITLADGTTETVQAGDVYYMPPGHTGVATDQDTTYVEFSLREPFVALMGALSKIIGG